MSVKIPAQATLTEENMPLREAALRAVSFMRDALEDGSWMPSEDRDPDFRLDTVQAHAETDVSVFDLAICRDLIDICLGAIELGEWADVSEDTIVALQRFNFLIHLVEEFAPSPAAYEVGLAS